MQSLKKYIFLDRMSQSKNLRFVLPKLYVLLRLIERYFQSQKIKFALPLAQHLSENEPERVLLPCR